MFCTLVRSKTAQYIFHRILCQITLKIVVNFRNTKILKFSNLKFPIKKICFATIIIILKIDTFLYISYQGLAGSWQLSIFLSICAQLFMFQFLNTNSAKTRSTFSNHLVQNLFLHLPVQMLLPVVVLFIVCDLITLAKGFQQLLDHLLQKSHIFCRSFFFVIFFLSHREKYLKETVPRL